MTTNKELNNIYDGIISPYRIKTGEEGLFMSSDGNRKYLYYVNYHDTQLTLVDEKGKYHKIDSSLTRRFWWKEIVKDDTKIKEFLNGFRPMFEDLGLWVVLKDIPSSNTYQFNIKKNDKIVFILSHNRYGSVIYMIDLYYCGDGLAHDDSFELALHESQLTYSMNVMMMNTFLMIMKVKGVLK